MEAMRTHKLGPSTLPKNYPAAPFFDPQRLPRHLSTEFSGSSSGNMQSIRHYRRGLVVVRE